MPTTKTTTRPGGKTRKSPLSSTPSPTKKSPFTVRSSGTSPTAARVRPMTPAERRDQQVHLFETYLDTTTSKRKRPYSDNSKRCFMEAIRSLMTFLEDQTFDGECHEITYLELNMYLAWYKNEHSLGGVATKEGNLRQFFTWLTDEYDLAENQYAHRKRNHYGRENTAPPALSPEFLQALLDTCNGRDFADLRDGCILRILLLGPRLGEIAAMQVEDMMIRDRVVKVRPFKHSDDWRFVPMPGVLAKGIARYLRARADLGLPADSGDLWISVKRKEGMNKSGIYQMLRRRVRETEYDDAAVYPHLFRHTAAGLAKAAGLSDEAMMQLFGWKDSTMVQRYGRSGAQERALDAARAAGFGEMS